MNLPNKITTARLILIPFIIAFYLCGMFVPEMFEWGRLVAVILFAVAAFTDFLDGYIARKYNLVTDLGKLLDPIADKTLTTTGLILVSVDLAFSTYNMGLMIALATFATIISIARDFLNSMIRQIGATKGKVIAAVWSGKIRTNVVLFTTIFAFLFLLNYNLNWFGGVAAQVIEVITMIGFILTVAFNIWSATDYVNKNKEIFEKGDKK